MLEHSYLKVPLYYLYADVVKLDYFVVGCFIILLSIEQELKKQKVLIHVIKIQ